MGGLGKGWMKLKESGAAGTAFGLLVLTLSVLLIGTVVAKCLLWVPGQVPCPFQRVWSGVEGAPGRQSFG